MASGFSVMNGRQNTCVAMRFKEERSHQLYKEASDELGLCAQNVQNIRHFVNFLKEGWNCGCDPSLTNFFIKSSLAHCVSEPILKVGQPAATIPCLLGSRRRPPRSSGSLVVLSFVRRAQVLACLLAGWLAGYGGGVGLLQPNPRLASHALDARALATGPVDEHGTCSVCCGIRSSSQRE
jgi:hypothetical protein